MDKKFIVTPKENPTATVSVRIDIKYLRKLEEIADKSGRSRNELINMAVKFALDNLKFVDNKKQGD